MLTMEMDHIKETRTAYQRASTERPTYRMESTPRGYCLIINNKDYTQESSMPSRIGTDVNRDDLKQVFTELGFKVDAKDNLTGQAMKDTLKKFAAKEGLTGVDSLIVAFLCHGNSQKLFGVDGVPLYLQQDVYEVFSPRECPDMKEKPKLILINSCRGDQGYIGTTGGTGPFDSVKIVIDTRSPDDTSPISSFQDLYLAFSTFYGQMSYRNTVEGSWYISKLVEVFREKAASCDIHAMMTQVNHRVASRCDPRYRGVQVPAPCTTLTKDWYFNPPTEGNDLPVEILQMDQQSIQLYQKCLEEKEEEDYRLRVIVIGQTEVGKTTLTRNLLRLPQIIPHTKSTDGVDIHNSFVNLDDKDWITDADLQHGGKCMDARLIQSLQSIASENTGADPNTEGDKSAQTASNSDDVSFSSGEFDNDDQQNAGHARQIQSPDSTAFKKAGADPDDLKKLGPSTPANSNESVLKTLRNLMKGPLADRDYTRLGELSVWDFAGQFVFYTTHHTFLTHRAVYLLVTRLDQNINDTVGNDQCFLDATGCKEMKIKDFVSYWMNSVHLYSGAAEHLPPVILVGTHLDKVEGDIEKKTETYFDDLRRYLLDMESPTSCHLIDTDYAVSNPPNELEIGNLRKKIVELASKQAYWGEKIPAKWITLEKALMEKKIEGVNIMSYEKVVELDKSTGVPIDDQKKIDLFLRFQHAKGNMIYFSEDCLRDYIVLNPQWLIDAFKCIITAQQICTKNPALVKHWKALDKTGKLYLGMVDEIFRREDKFCRHKEHILGLMERLHIISHHVVDKDDDKSNTSEEFYFVPSLLKDKVTECEIENYVKGTNGTPYLCYVFENNFLPTAVFHRLIAACLSEYTVAKQGSKFLIFCGCGIFDLNGGLTRLVVAFYDNIIQIGLFRFSKERCAPETSTCVSVRQFVTKTLERVLDRYDMKLPFTLNLKCEKSPLLSHEGLLSEDAVIKGGEEMVCHGHDKESHIINRDILLHLWFPAQVAATNTNQGGAKHYNKASNEDIPEEAIVIHNEMVNHLDGYIYGDDLIKLKELFKEIPLTPAVMGKIHKIHDLFTHLIDSETIRIGCYKNLTPNLRQINRKLATLVENKEKDIRDIIN